VAIDVYIVNLKDWGLPQKKFFIVAGPCSVETEEQIMETALGLRQCEVNVLRGGIWKPRTRPDSFQGVGEKGLTWLKNAGNAAHLPVTVEVAHPEHVEKCLQAGIDILWIGARTTANPFSVQAIADSLKGVSIPVMVKNPTTPDIELRIGAFERLNQAGIKKLIAVHRGFAVYKKNLFRNLPVWRIPIELRRQISDLPILCDPSHICGSTDLLQSVSQEAVDLLYDGLMIEVHVNPRQALSDAQQQITPAEFVRLIGSLNPKRISIDNEEFRQHMSGFRQNLDEIDLRIIELLAQRMDIAREIGAFKRKNNVSSFQPDRWDEVLRSRTQTAIDRNLSPDFIQQIYEYIHEESLRNQIETEKDEHD